MITILSLIEKGYANWNNAKVLTEVADTLETLNRLNFALTFAKRAIELEPAASYEPYLTWSFVCFRSADIPEEEGQKALEEGYNATKSAVSRAWMAAVAKTDADADQWLEEAKQDESFDAQAAIANAYSWRRKTNDAYQVLKTFPERFSNEGQPEWGSYCGMLMYLKQTGMDQDLERDVLPVIHKLLEVHPELPSNYNLLMRYHTVMGNHEAAREAALRCLAMFPDDETTMYTLAGIYEKLGDIETAKHWCSRAIGAKHSYVGARIRLAGYYEQDGNVELADSLMEEIPVVNPLYKFGSVRLAVYRLKRGKEEEAISLFREVYPTLQPWEQASVANNEQGKELLQKSGLA